MLCGRRSKSFGRCFLRRWSLRAATHPVNVHLLRSLQCPAEHGTPDRMGLQEPTSQGRMQKCASRRVECMAVGPHISVGIWSHGSQISEQAGCPATDDANPVQGHKEGAGTGSDLTLRPGSDLGCSAPIHLHPREHRNHARTGIMFRRRPRRRPACPSTQAPRQHRSGSLACRRHRYPHSHPTHHCSSRRRPPCVAGCRKFKRK